MCSAFVVWCLAFGGSCVSFFFRLSLVFDVWRSWFGVWWLAVGGACLVFGVWGIGVWCVSFVLVVSYLVLSVCFWYLGLHV